jgi:hypothetical protein
MNAAIQAALLAQMAGVEVEQSQSTQQQQPLPATASEVQVKEQTSTVTAPTPPSGTSSMVSSMIVVTEHDVLCGRGGETNHHPGNVAYRGLVKSNQPLYIKAKRRDKPKIARAIVDTIMVQYGGRFLKRASGSEVVAVLPVVEDATGAASPVAAQQWVEISVQKAREKTSQALRENAPTLRNKEDHLVLVQQQHLQDQVQSRSISMDMVQTVSPLFAPSQVAPLFPSPQPSSGSAEESQKPSSSSSIAVTATCVAAGTSITGTQAQDPRVTLRGMSAMGLGLGDTHIGGCTTDSNSGHALQLHSTPDYHSRARTSSMSSTRIAGPAGTPHSQSQHCSSPAGATVADSLAFTNTTTCGGNEQPLGGALSHLFAHTHDPRTRAVLAQPALLYHERFYGAGTSTSASVRNTHTDTHNHTNSQYPSQDRFGESDVSVSRRSRCESTTSHTSTNSGRSEVTDGAGSLALTAGASNNSHSRPLRTHAEPQDTLAAVTTATYSDVSHAISQPMKYDPVCYTGRDVGHGYVASPEHQHQQHHHGHRDHQREPSSIAAIAKPIPAKKQLQQHRCYDYVAVAAAEQHHQQQHHHGHRDHHQPSKSASIAPAIAIPAKKQHGEGESVAAAAFLQLFNSASSRKSGAGAVCSPHVHVQSQQYSSTSPLLSSVPAIPISPSTLCGSDTRFAGATGSSSSSVSSTSHTSASHASISLLRHVHHQSHGGGPRLKRFKRRCMIEEQVQQQPSCLKKQRLSSSASTTAAPTLPFNMVQ